MKTIINVSFKTLLNEEDLKSTTSKDLPHLTEVPGLISKTFHINPKTARLGAVYQFEDDEAADSYLNSPFLKNMPDRYKVADGTLSIEKAHVTFVLKGRNTEGNNQRVRKEL